MKTALLIVATLVSASLSAQTSDSSNCKVKDDALKGSYSGDCKNGLANGIGKASGPEDSYSGEFKDGLPDGHGTYKWKNGNWIEADWSKGKLNGFSIMHYLDVHGKDSLSQEGWYKKGKYIGEYEKPYLVYSTSSSLTRTEFRKSPNKSGKNFQLIININGITGDIRKDAGAVVPMITDIQLIRGDGGPINEMDNQVFNRPTQAETIGGNHHYIFQDVKYPVRLKVKMGIEYIDFQIFEKGDWQLDMQFFK